MLRCWLPAAVGKQGRRYGIASLDGKRTTTSAVGPRCHTVTVDLCCVEGYESGASEGPSLGKVSDSLSLPKPRVIDRAAWIQKVFAQPTRCRKLTNSIPDSPVAPSLVARGPGATSSIPTCQASRKTGCRLFPVLGKWPSCLIRPLLGNSLRHPILCNPYYHLNGREYLVHVSMGRTAPVYQASCFLRRSLQRSIYTPYDSVCLTLEPIQRRLVYLNTDMFYGTRIP